MAALGISLGIPARSGRRAGADLGEFENVLIDSAGNTLVNSRGMPILSGATGGTARLMANSSGRILVNSAGKALLMPN